MFVPRLQNYERSSKKKKKKVMAAENEDAPPTNGALDDAATGQHLKIANMSPVTRYDSYKKKSMQKKKISLDDSCCDCGNNKNRGNGDGEEDYCYDQWTASTQPSSTGTLGSSTTAATTTPPSSCPSTPLSPPPPPPPPPPRSVDFYNHWCNHDEDTVASKESSAETEGEITCAAGRVRQRLENVKKRKVEEAEELISKLEKTKGDRLARRKLWIEEAEKMEEVFQKKIDVLAKNPAMFREFKSRSRGEGCLTPCGVRMVLREFSTDMKIVEMLDDIRVEQDDDDEGKDEDEPEPRGLRRLNIFASFGYRRNSSTATSSSNNSNGDSDAASTATANSKSASSTAAAAPPATPSSRATPAGIISKNEMLHRGRMFRNAGRSYTGGSYCSHQSDATDNDARSFITFESIGLSLPSLEHTTSSLSCDNGNPGISGTINEEDDCSSVGSVSVSGWVTNSGTSPGSSLSLNGSPRSGRSLLLGTTEMEEEDDDEDDQGDDEYDELMAL